MEPMTLADWKVRLCELNNKKNILLNIITLAEDVGKFPYIAEIARGEIYELNVQMNHARDMIADLSDV